MAPPSQSFCSRARPPLVCAHGGDTTSAPPNTVAAFRASLAAGADCVEIDAALSKDGVLVVLHVRELTQLLGKPGMQVGDLPSSELLSLRWPGGDRVMAVAEAVRLTAPHVSCVTLDIKTYNDKDGQPTDELAVAEAVVRLVHDTRCTNCLVWAKSDVVVARVLELSPGQRVGYIVMNETAEARAAGMHVPLRMGAPAVAGVHHAMVHPQLLDQLHGAGKQLFAWTVNSAEHLRSVLDVGVDALVTNYPTTALAAIEERLAQCARRGGSGGGGNSGKGNGRSGRSRGRGKQHRGGGNGVSNDGDYL